MAGEPIVAAYFPGPTLGCCLDPQVDDDDDGGGESSKAGPRRPMQLPLTSATHHENAASRYGWMLRTDSGSGSGRVKSIR